MLDHHQLFPTNIFTKNNFLNEKLFKNVHDSVINDKEHISIQPLELEIYKTLEELSNFLSLEKYTAEITEIWGNVSKQGKDHPVHSHPNNTFSGILYLTPGVSTTFVDANPANGMILLDTKNPHLNNHASLAAIPNMLVIFPSWLPHYVPANPDNHTRKTVSFNVILRGEYGGENSLAKVKI